jgi:leucyl aminopeptidase (aminopeptidase T)
MLFDEKIGGTIHLAIGPAYKGWAELTKALFTGI